MVEENNKEKLESLLDEYLDKDQLKKVNNFFKDHLPEYIKEEEIHSIMISKNPKSQITEKVKQFKPVIEDNSDLIIKFSKILNDPRLIPILSGVIIEDLNELLTLSDEVNELNTYLDLIQDRPKLFVEIIQFISKSSENKDSFVMNARKIIEFENEFDNPEDEIFFNNFMECIDLVSESIHKYFIQFLLSCEDIKKNSLTNRYNQSLGDVNRQLKDSKKIPINIKNIFYIENIEDYRNAMAHKSYDYDPEKKILIIKDKNNKFLFQRNRKEIEKLYYKLCKIINTGLFEFFYYYLLKEVIKENLHSHIFNLTQNSEKELNNELDLDLIRKNNSFFDEFFTYFGDKYIKNKK